MEKIATTNDLLADKVSQREQQLRLAIVYLKSTVATVESALERPGVINWWADHPQGVAYGANKLEKALTAYVDAVDTLQQVTGLDAYRAAQEAEQTDFERVAASHEAWLKPEETR